MYTEMIGCGGRLGQHPSDEGALDTIYLATRDHPRSKPHVPEAAENRIARHRDTSSPLQLILERLSTPEQIFSIFLFSNQLQTQQLHNFYLSVFIWYN